MIKINISSVFRSQPLWICMLKSNQVKKISWEINSKIDSLKSVGFSDTTTKPRIISFEGIYNIFFKPSYKSITQYISPIIV